MVYRTGGVSNRAYAALGHAKVERRIPDQYVVIELPTGMLAAVHKQVYAEARKSLLLGEAPGVIFRAGEDS